MRLEPYVVKSVFSDAECLDILDICKYKELKTSGIGVHKTKAKESMIRQSKQAWVHEIQAYEEKFLHIMNGVKQAVPDWNLRFLYREPWQYTVYDKGDHYTWHNDQTHPSEDGSIRALSTILLLQGASRGGILETSEGVVQLSQGDWCVFPSFLEHRVTPVELGQRISLVGWYRCRA